MASSRKLTRPARKNGTGVTSPAYVAGPNPISKDFLDETITIWQPRSQKSLSREDAREIIHNTVGFFRILQEWDEAERLAGLKMMKATVPTKAQPSKDDMLSLRVAGSVRQSALFPDEDN